MFEARNSRWRLALMALLGAGFVTIGVWLVGGLGLDHPDGIEVTVIGWVSIAFFGACAIAALLRMRDAGVVMRVDDRGIWWKQLSDAIIPWSEIEAVGVVTIHHQKMLGLAVPDPARYRRKAIKDRLAATNEALTGYPLCLTVAGTDRSFADLLDAVTRHMARP